MVDLEPARWYYLQDSQQVGPVELAQMREWVIAGQISPTTMVWADGMPGWLPANQVPALVPPPGAVASAES